MFKKFNDKYRKEYMTHVRPCFLMWFDSLESIDVDDYEKFCDKNGMNSYERNLIYPKMTLNLALHTAEEYAKQCGGNYGDFTIASSYDKALIHKVLPRIIAIMKDN